MLRVWLIMMFAGAGGIVVGSFATSRILDSVQQAPTVVASQAAASVRVDAKQARDWLQSTVARGRWMTHRDPAFRTEYVVRPGKDFDSLKPGMAVASNRGRRAAADGREL